METTVAIAVAISLLIAAVGGVMIVVEAFKNWIGWGLLVLFFPVPFTWVFVFLNWSETRRAFFLNLGGVLSAVLFGAILVSAETQENPESGEPVAEASNDAAPSGEPDTVDASEKSTPSSDAAREAELAKRAELDELLPESAFDGGPVSAEEVLRRHSKDATAWNASSELVLLDISLISIDGLVQTNKGGTATALYRAPSGTETLALSYGSSGFSTDSKLPAGSSTGLLAPACSVKEVALIAHGLLGGGPLGLRYAYDAKRRGGVWTVSMADGSSQQRLDGTTCAVLTR